MGHYARRCPVSVTCAGWLRCAFPDERAALGIFNVFPSFHRVDKVFQPGSQRSGKKLLIGTAQDYFAQRHPRPAGIKADVIAGVVVEERNPGRVPMIIRFPARGCCLQLLFSRPNLAGAHQPPVLFQAANSIWILAVVPGKQCSQVRGQRAAELRGKIIQIGLTGARTQCTQEFRPVFAQPSFEPGEDFA